MAKRIESAHGRRHNRAVLHIRNRMIPAAVTALSLMVIVAILSYLNFDFKYGLGASGIVFASFGGSAFALFMLPYSRSSNVRRFIKSYLIAGLFGYLGFLTVPYMGTVASVGLVMFSVSVLLIVTGSEHPPALGIASAFVLYNIDYVGIIIVMVAALILAFIRMVMLKYVYVLEKESLKAIEKIDKRLGAT